MGDENQPIEHHMFRDGTLSFEHGKLHMYVDHLRGRCVVTFEQFAIFAISAS